MRPIRMGPTSIPPLIPYRPGQVLLSGVIVVVITAIVLGLLLYAIQFSPLLQWVLGFVFLTVLVAFAWRRVAQGTSEPVSLVSTPRPEPFEPGEMSRFAVTVQRASRGLPYSQVLVASRARRAFLERVRLALGLSPDAIQEAEGDRRALRRLVGDEVLVEFLHSSSRDLDARYEWAVRSRARGGFSPEFQDILDRMEAWG